MMSSFFELSGVTKNFGGVQAVSKMTFSMEKGELAGLMGPKEGKDHGSAADNRG